MTRIETFGTLCKIASMKPNGARHEKAMTSRAGLQRWILGRMQVKAFPFLNAMTGLARLARMREELIYFAERWPMKELAR